MTRRATSPARSAEHGQRFMIGLLPARTYNHGWGWRVASLDTALYMIEDCFRHLSCCQYVVTSRKCAKPYTNVRASNGDVQPSRQCCASVTACVVGRDFEDAMVWMKGTTIKITTSARGYAMLMALRTPMADSIAVGVRSMVSQTR